MSALGDRLEAFGIPFTVESVKQGFETEQLLTDTRRERLDSPPG